MAHAFSLLPSAVEKFEHVQTEVHDEVKLVMTLLARDEADIIDAHVSYHLASGVDYVIASDHESSDGTTEILESYAHQGVLHLLHVRGNRLRQSEWVTRMARMAAADYGADWVINSDADEFWWTSNGDLKEALDLVPRRFGVLRSFVRPFLPRPGKGEFQERMTVRFSPAAAVNDPGSPFRVNARLLHRGVDDIVVTTGNTAVRSPDLSSLTTGSYVEILHFPIRSFAQFERKLLSAYETTGGMRRDHVRAFEAAQAGRLTELYERICVDDATLQRGLVEGVLTRDARLRDALEERARGAGATAIEARGDLAHAVGYAVDRSVLMDGELVRAQRRLDELARRLDRLVGSHGTSGRG